MEIWDEEEFSIVGSVVGNPLFIDRITEERKNMTYARICVEIDTNCNFPNTVTVFVDNRRAYNLLIEYNWRPQKYDKCDSFGHTGLRCPHNKIGRSTAVWLKKDNQQILRIRMMKKVIVVVINKETMTCHWMGSLILKDQTAISI